MNTAAIKNAQFQALNQKGAAKPSVSFASELTRATAANPALKPLDAIRPAAPALRRSDFAAGNPALPVDPASVLKPLAAYDRGGARTTDLRTLAPTDFVPGARLKSHDPRQQIQEKAEKWVSQTFYGTMLKQMNDSPFKSDLFSGGRGGKAFAPMLSQHLADRMAHSSSNKLVRSVVKSLVKKAHLPSPAAEPLGPGARAPTPAPTAATVTNPYKDVRIHVSPDLGT